MDLLVVDDFRDSFRESWKEAWHDVPVVIA